MNAAYREGNWLERCFCKHETVWLHKRRSQSEWYGTTATQLTFWATLDCIKAYNEFGKLPVDIESDEQISEGKEDINDT